MTEIMYVTGSIVVMTLATFLTRSAAFFFLRKSKSGFVHEVGLYLPPAVMLLLVVYCLRNVDFSKAPFGLVEMLSVVVVVLLHLWKSHALLSIGLGTALYVVFLRTDILPQIF